ncbi:DUF4062 domain-containing protein [Nocardia asiatica]|uniref:DUF4062 domain-containing protein n=1 Tax=Nocardia asiatica TaxID=209252 RepID=UPI0024537EA3|nr:DUF4062 domain-containing protein [Nocardia asiatica]
MKTKRPTSWRRLPLFIASTFRDMDYERDMINRIVIPSVNGRLVAAGQGVEIYPVDLRWGVEADERFDEDTRERIVMETCLSEVKRCRPLFLGILGSKYGYVPTGTKIAGVIADAGVSVPNFPMSITALEMLIAVQAGIEDGSPPIIVARRVPLHDREASVRAGALDDLPGSPGAEHLRRLESRLHAMGSTPLEYHATWNSDGGRLESDDFATLVADEIFSAVQRITWQDLATDWLQHELDAHRWAAQREAKHFVGRRSELEFVQKFWSQNFLFGEFDDVGDETGSPLHALRIRRHNSMIGILGDSGSGKTALMAKIALDVEILSLGERISKRPAARAYCQVGATVASTRLAVCLLILLAQLDPEAAHEIAENTTADTVALSDVLDRWIAKLESAVPMFGPIVIVDGIDRLGDSLVEAQSISWMSTSFGDRARFIVSAESSSAEAQMLRLRPLTEILEIGQLELEDARALVVGRSRAHHKAIPDLVVDQLTGRSTTARWLSLATELLLTLMRHDYLVLKNIEKRIADPQQAVRQLLIDVSENLPADLDDLHMEAIERLSEFCDQWFGALLGILGTSFFGLRGSDLFAMYGPNTPGATVLRELGATRSAMDLALARDLLTGIVTVTRDEWQFSHSSALGAVENLLDTSADLLEVKRSAVRTGYSRMLASYLFSLPIEDPVRSRELMPQLYILDENRALAKVIANPDLSTDESISVFGTFLSGQARRNPPISDFTDMITATEEDQDTLSVIAVVSALLLTLGEEARHGLAQFCLSALSTIEPGAKSRFGSDASDIRATIEVLNQDPFNVETHSRAGIVNDWALAFQRGDATLRDIPRFDAHGKTEAILALQSELAMLTLYALATSMATIPAPGSDDADCAIEILDRWREHIDAQQEPNRNLDELLRLTYEITCRAAALAWPSIEVAVVESDFDRAVQLTSRLRGNPDPVVLLGRIARVRAAGSLARLMTLAQQDEVDELGEAEAEEANEILKQIDEALWHLKIHLALAPHSFAVEAELIHLLALKSVFLSAFDQDASSCRAGLEACMFPNVVKAIGWEMFAELAISNLFDWTVNGLDLDPSPVIRKLLGPREEGDLSLLVDDPVRFEIGLLMSSLKAATQFGALDNATAAVDRFLSRHRAGLIEPPEGLGLDEGQELPDMIRGFLEETEDDLLELLKTEHTEILDSHESDRQPFLQVCGWMHEVRMKLSTGRPDDVLGACFVATLHAALSRSPQWIRRSTVLRGQLTVYPLPERAPQLLTVIDALLSTSVESIDWDAL